jgi:hypothetical protein
VIDDAAAHNKGMRSKIDKYKGSVASHIDGMNLKIPPII